MIKLAKMFCAEVVHEATSGSIPTRILNVTFGVLVFVFAAWVAFQISGAISTLGN